METLIIIVLKILLSFYILSILYLLLMYYLKNTQAISTQKAEMEKPFRENHIALIYNGVISEADLLNQIQFLKQQNYQNFSAYFFTDSAYLDANYISNVNIQIIPKKAYAPYELVHFISHNFFTKPDAVMVVRPNVVLMEGIFENLNLGLLHGQLVAQCKIEVMGQQPASYQAISKKFFNFIDREAMSANGISAALWNHGFIIDYPNFKNLSFSEPNYTDKDIQAELISRSIHIHYHNQIIVKEKPIQIQEYVITRGKWIANYAFQAKIGFQLLVEAVKNPNLDKIIFGLNYLRPPLWLMFFASVGLLVLDNWEMSALPFFNYTALCGIMLSGIILFYNNLYPSNFTGSLSKRKDLIFIDPN
jgi:hypothetical protein